MKSGTVAIIGRPNAGKSTFLNAVVGEHISIVSDKPQTTRYRILGMLTEPRGQIVLADTPGIHKPGYRMNERMQRVVRDVMRDMDMLLHMIDAGASLGAGENYVLDMVKAAGRPAILLLNKIDTIAKPRLLPLIERCSAGDVYCEIIPVSARSGENVGLVLERLFAHLPEGGPLFENGALTDRSERFLSAEYVREKILQRTREEIPYATAVLVRRFDESDRDKRKLVRIEADIVVEKRSQQGIILGAGGHQLRDIGTAARADLEKLLACRVYLGLTVRTVPKWRDEDSVLDELEVGL